MTGKKSENNILANKPTTVEQIKTLNINNKANHHQDQIHPRTKSRSSMKQHIKQLQQEQRDLRGNSIINKTHNNPSFEETKQQPKHSQNAKNEKNRDQQQNMEIINMISYTDQTMKN